MKKMICIFIAAIAMVIFTSWNGLDIPRRTITQELASFQGKNNVLRFQPSSGGYDWNVFSYSLDQYAGQNVEIKVAMQIWLDNSAKILLQVHTGSSYPTVYDSDIELSAGRWHAIQGSRVINIQKGNVLYLSPYLMNNASGYIAELNIDINVINVTYENNLPALHTKWPFKVGTVLSSEDFSTPQNGLFRHYNVITINTLYPFLIMPEPWTPNGRYRWEDTDKLISYAESNGKNVRAHTLFWHMMTPVEFFRGSGRDGWATKDELYARMEHHARTVFQKYRDRIEYWDLFNEVVAYEGTIHPGVGRGADNNMNLIRNGLSVSLYTQIMEDAGLTGMDRYEFVLKAFQLARQYADANGGQNVKLILNENDIDTNRNKLTGFLRLLDYLIANNAPIDGVGIQGHIWHLDSGRRSYVRDLERAIDAITAKRNPVTGRNLVVQLTELDISLYNANETNWNNLPASKKTLTDREINTRIPQQAALYRDLFNMLEQKYNQGKIDMVVMWGIADGHSWLNYFPVQGRTDYPLLFDRNYQAKPAFHELIRGK